MMNNVKNVHLVPQAVIDAASNFIQNSTSLNADLHRHRIESIRDYCQAVLDHIDGPKEIPQKNTKKSKATVTNTTP